jgi:hypothetical protein
MVLLVEVVLVHLVVMDLPVMVEMDHRTYMHMVQPHL